MSPSLPQPSTLTHTFGRIDIYLLDQLLKGNIHPEMRILDAGCGGGRNLVYLMQLGSEVYGVDTQAEAIDAVQDLAAHYAPNLPSKNFIHVPIEDIAFPINYFDAIICSAVLHFSKDVRHFHSMLRAMFRSLKPGGIFFARLASDIGIEDRVRPIQEKERWFDLPDGTQRFLVNIEMLHEAASMVDGKLYEPIKTVRVEGMRCMTNWFLQKS